MRGSDKGVASTAMTSRAIPTNSATRSTNWINSTVYLGRLNKISGKLLITNWSIELSN